MSSRTWCRCWTAFIGCRSGARRRRGRRRVAQPGGLSSTGSNPGANGMGYPKRPSLRPMIDPLEELVPRAERARAELNQLLEQLEAEREAVKAATIEAHEAVQGLRSAVREAKEEMRQASKAEARKHLARQMRAAADILARDS